MGDIYTSLVGMLGVLCALRHRDLTGQGQYVDISMVDCMLSLNELAMLLYSLLGEESPRYDGRSSPIGAYRCRDGYVMVSCVKNDDWLRLVEVIGRPDLAAREDLAMPQQRTALQESVLRPAIEDWTVQHTKRDAALALARANIPAAPVQRPADISQDPHVLARRMLVDVPHPAGSVRMVANPIKMSKVEEVYRPAPRLGQDTDEVLGGVLGLAADEIRQLRESGII